MTPSLPSERVAGFVAHLRREGYRIGIPQAGEYRQLLNSDAARFGGSDFGMTPVVESSPEPAQRRPYSLVLTLPPLGMVVFGPKREAVIQATAPAAKVRKRRTPKEA